MSPARPLLSREQIVAAAIDLLDRDGPDAFSMRRLGAALKVDPMAVYHHLPNKAALFDAVVDALWGMAAESVAAETPASDDWRALVGEYKRIVREELGHDFPQDPLEQLWGAITLAIAAYGIFALFINYKAPPESE